MRNAGERERAREETLVSGEKKSFSISERDDGFL